MGMRFAFFMVMLTFSPAAADELVGDPPSCSNLPYLDEWLCNAKFTLPTFALQSALLTVTITEMQCYGARISELSTTPNPTAGGGKTPTLAFTFGAADIYCESSRVHVGKGIISTWTSMTLTVSSITSSATIELAVDHDGLPASAQLLNNKAELGDLKLSIFHFLELGWLVDLLRPIIINKVVSTVNNLVSHNVTALLENVDAMVKPLLSQPPLLPETENYPSAIDWRHSVALEETAFVLDKVIGPDGPFGLNGVVRSLTGGTGEVLLNGSALHIHVEAPIGALGNVSVALGTTTISGLDSVEELDLLTPVQAADGAHSINSSLALRAVMLNTSLVLGFAPGGSISATTLSLPMTLRVNLEDIVAGAVLFAPVNSSISIGQLLKQHTCLGAAVLDASLRRLQLRLSPKQFWVDGPIPGLAKLVAKAINDVLELFNDAFEVPIREAIDGVAGGPVQNVTNTYIHELIGALRADTRCDPIMPDPVPPTLPDAVDWRENSVLSLVDFALDQVVGADGPLGVNGLVHELTGGALQLDTSSMNPVVSGHFGPLGAVNVSLLEAGVAGLDRMTELALLEPVASDGTLLRSEIGVDGLSVSVRLSVSTSLMKAPVDFGFNVTLHQAVIGATTRVALNQTGLARLEVGEWVQLGCIAREVEGIAVPAMNLSSHLVDLSVWGNEWGERKASSVSLSVPAQLPKGVEALVLHATNKALAALLATARGANCTASPPAPIPPPGAHDTVDWRENSVLSLVDFALDQVVGADGPLGVNGLVHELTGGALQLDTSSMNPVVSGHFGPLGAVNVSLLEAGVAGLDRMTELALLEPVASDGTLLRSEIGVDGLSVSVRLSVSTSLMKAPVDFGFNVTLHQAVIGATTRVALNQTGLARLEVGEWMQLGCIAREVEGIAVPAMNLSSHLVDLSVWGNEWGERKASSVSLSVPAQLPRGMEALVLHATNKALAALLATARGANCTASPPAPMPPPGAHDTVDWRENSVLSLVDFALDQVVGADGPLGVNGLVHELTGGALQLDTSSMNPVVSGHFGPLGAVNVSLLEAGVAGLDRMTELALLEPVASDGTLLRSEIGVDGLSVSVRLSVSTSLMKAPVDFGFNVTLHQAVIGATTRVALNQTGLARLEVGEWVQLGCIAREVEGIAVPAMNLSSHLVDLSVWGNEWGERKASSVSLSVPAQLPRGMEALVLHATNKALAALLATARKASCTASPPAPMPPPGAHDTVDWRENSVLSLVDFALDQVVGADGPLGVNGLVHELTGGALQLDTSSMNPVVSGHFGPLGAVNVSLLEAGVAGLDRMTELALLEPVASDGTLLRSEIGVDGLSVSVRLSVSTSLMKAPVDFGFNVTLHQAVIGATTRVALNQTGLARLEVGEWVQLGCIAREVEGIAVPAMNLSSHLVDLSVWGNEWGERKASSVSLSVPAQLPRGMEALVLHATNKALAALLATARKASCTASPPAPMPPPGAHDTVDWRENSVLSLVDFALDQVVGADGPLGVNGLVHELTGGALQLDTSSMNPVVSGHFGPLGAVNVSLLEAGVAGLDRMTELALLEPVASDGTLLRSEIGVDGLSVSVRLSVSTSLMKAPVDFGFNVTLHQAVIGATTRVALNQTGLARLEVGEWVQLGCIAREVEGIAVPAMNLSSHLVDLSVWGNEWGERKASSVSLSVPAQLPKGAEALVLHVTNKALAALLATARGAACSHGAPTPPPPPPPSTNISSDTVDWRNSLILDVLSLLDARIGDALIRAVVPSGSFAVDVSAVKPFKVRNMNVSLLEAGVAGLDKWTELTLFQPVASDGTLLHSEIGVDGLSVSVRLSVSTSLTKAPVDFGFNVTLHQAVIGATTRVALNKTGLGALQAHQILNSTSCIMRQIEAFDFEDLTLQMRSLELAVWGNEWSTRPSSSVELRQPLLPSPSLVRRLRNVLNPLVTSKLVALQSPFCPRHNSPPLQVMDYRSSASVARMASQLNVAIPAFLKRVDHVLIPIAIPLPPVHDPKLGTIRVRLSNVNISGLSSVFNFSILNPDPDDPIRLQNQIGFYGSQPLAGHVTLQVQLDGLWHSFDIVMDAQGVVFDLGIRLGLDPGYAGSLSAAELMARPSCMLQPIVNASLTAGSRTDILSALGGYLAMSITTRAGDHALLNESVMPSHLRGTFEAVLSVLDSKLQQTLDRQHSECLYGPPPPPPPTPADAGLSSVAWLLIILGLMLSLPVLICIARRHFRKPSARELEQMANCANGRLELIDKLDENGFPVDPRKGHLAAHYPPLYRIAFSVLIVANMCLYAVAHSTPGATMNVLLKIAGETVLLPDIFIFTLPGSVRDEWNSGSYALASLVAAASGIWPFVKLSSNLIMWWMPSRWMSIDKQGLAIRFLDATGKFVITDTQMVVLLMVAFRFSIVSQGEGEAHIADADVVVTPDIGVTTFIIATLISLVIGHTHVHMHRSARRVFRMDMKGQRGIGCSELGATPLDGVQVDLARVPDQTIVASRSTALCKLHFNKLFCYKDRKIPHFLRMLVPIMLVVCSTGIIIGCQMTSFSITIEGLVGSLVGRGRKTDWSITLLAEKIPTVTHLASPVLMRTLQVGFFLTCCVIPVLDATLCAFLWCVPLRRSTQHTLLVVCEIGLAWSMLEVLAIILLTSLLSLDQFAKFSLGDECTGINHLLQSYPELANKVLPEGSERDCLGIVPSLENGYYVFAAASLISVPFCLLVLHAANTALEEQASQAQKPLSGSFTCTRQAELGTAGAACQPPDYTAVHPSARSSEAPQRGGLATPLLAE